jgi:hypothetical protein
MALASMRHHGPAVPIPSPSQRLWFVTATQARTMVRVSIRRGVSFKCHGRAAHHECWLVFQFDQLIHEASQ